MADESKEKNTHRYNKNVENIDDDSSTLNQFSFKGTKSNTLRIRPNTDFDETQFRCAVTGKNGDVIYSESVKVTQEVKARITMNLKQAAHRRTLLPLRWIDTLLTAFIRAALKMKR